MHSGTIQWSRQPKFQFCHKVGKGRHVYVRVGGNFANAWLPLQTYGKLQRAITSFLRRESKFFQVKSLVSIHSACPCKNYPPKCSQTPHELDYLFNSFIFKLACTLSRKKMSRNHIIHLGYTVEPYKASKQPRMHSRTIQSKETTHIPILRNFLNNAHHGYSPFFT